LLLKVINPNTSQAMTTSIGQSATAIAAPDTTVEVVSPAMGPESIESHYDEALAVPGVLAEIAAGEQAGVSGYVIACFGDPGLDAAREIARGPVVGIAEAAMRTAAFLGRSFSVVTTLDRSRGRTWDLADRYGLSKFCRGVHATDIAVLDLDLDPSALKKVIAASLAAATTDGSDAIVLGCAGMSAFGPAISAEIGLPVVDGVQAGVLLVQSLVRMGLRTGSLGEFAPPLPKKYTGLLRDFERR
jgi:allantoin racemase